MYVMFRSRIFPKVIACCNVVKRNLLPYVWYIKNVYYLHVAGKGQSAVADSIRRWCSRSGGGTCTVMPMHTLTGLQGLCS